MCSFLFCCWGRSHIEECPGSSSSTLGVRYRVASFNVSWSQTSLTSRSSENETVSGDTRILPIFAPRSPFRSSNRSTVTLFVHELEEKESVSSPQ